MHLSFSCCIWLGVTVHAAAVHRPRDIAPGVFPRQNYSSVQPYEIPPDVNDPARVLGIETKRENFLYGPSPAGPVPFFPAGPLGNAIVQKDVTDDSTTFLAVGQAVAADQALAIAAITQAGGFNSLADYGLLYKNQWKKSVPEGEDAGIQSNYTEDLLFSMERLSVAPYSIRRLHEYKDKLPFLLDDATAIKIAGTTLGELHVTGSLFYADFRNQANLNRTRHFAAACDAYFYIHPKTNDFLPLAIRPNAGSNLTYTPLDTPNDWLLAKIMFNVNDFWFSQLYHFAATHEVVEIVYESAIRTLSDNHPVLAILKRIAFRAFAYRPLEASRLIDKGGAIDLLFPFPGSAAAQYQQDLYTSGIAGAFQANYFYEDLTSRGLYKSSFGPALKNFPFYDDASYIHSEIAEFMTTFVNSYYPNASLLTHDHELQSWLTEATGAAQVIDFPAPPLTQKSTLIDILTHLAFLATVVHHALNTNDPVTSTGTLPFHPTALYHAPPTAKNISSLLPYLPDPQGAVAQVALLAFFDRSKFRGTNLTLSHLFDGMDDLGRLNAQTRGAASRFRGAMQWFSREVVGERGFDARGLSQGMPFVWKGLDPEVIPFYLAI